jgi:hypothetical protein
MAARYIKAKSDMTNWRITVDLLKQSDLSRHKIWACELIELYGDHEALASIKEFGNDKNGHVRKKYNQIANHFNNC